MALKAANTIRGNAKVMRERQRVEVLRDLIAAPGFLSIDDRMATIVVDPKTRLMEPA
jgi:ABC-type lipopolysaccharide export system ATPase subunit